MFSYLTCDTCQVIERNYRLLLSRVKILKKKSVKKERPFVNAHHEVR